MSLALPDAWNAVAEGYDKTARPVFESFAAHAMDLAGVQPHHAVLDVACGPGTLSVIAAERGCSVLALDFAEAMVAVCSAHTKGYATVRVRHRDCQHLFLDESFDAAFSMFGLMFFPDRAAGFASLLRSLKPGGVAVVTCWPPTERSSAMRVAMGAMMAAFPDAPESPEPDLPLNSADQLTCEMQAADFEQVQVHAFEHRFHVSADNLWLGIAEGFAPLALARKTMPAEVWGAAEARGLAWLRRHHDEEQELSYEALFGHGRRP